MKYKSLLVLIIIFTNLLFTPASALAVVDPLAVPNNRFGVHIVDENDLDLAAELINSSQGDWGYVTIVIREDDRNLEKWQNTFERMRQLHLIPIVRLSTKHQGPDWQKPRIQDVDPWVTFLSSLNWVTQNRYVILFNEPNHSKEWGGDINPQEFADISIQYAQKLKSAHPDFFVLPAGIDLSASNTKDTMHPLDFYQQIYQSFPDYFTSFDGWTSHSYPNPNFSASPFNQGRNSVAGYLWEQNLLQEFGATPNLPIFITETGWIHSGGVTPDPNLLSPDTIAQYYLQAFKSVWNHPRVAMVAPFILNYQDEPFDHFSLLQPKTLEPYPTYLAIQSFPKNQGKPVQNHNAQVVKGFIPGQLPPDTSIMVAVTYHNTGQSIWESPEFNLTTTTQIPSDQITIDPVPQTMPGEFAKIWIKLDTTNLSGQIPLKLQLQTPTKSFGEPIDTIIQIEESKNFLSQFRLWLLSIFHNQDIIVYLLRNTFSYLTSTG